MPLFSILCEVPSTMIEQGFLYDICLSFATNTQMTLTFDLDRNTDLAK
jgi:hypothetical protein